jgi:aldehyde:ferredoxin oxidoreductase
MKMHLGLFFRAGDRGYNMERLFNLREGIGKDKDTLAKRFTDEPLVPGDETSKVPLDKMLPKYYKIRGWDENGVPTPKTLKRLGLDFADVSKLTGS